MTIYYKVRIFPRYKVQNDINFSFDNAPEPRQALFPMAHLSTPKKQNPASQSLAGFLIVLWRRGREHILLSHNLSAPVFQTITFLIFIYSVRLLSEFVFIDICACNASTSCSNTCIRLSFSDNKARSASQFSPTLKL